MALKNKILSHYCYSFVLERLLSTVKGKMGSLNNTDTVQMFTDKLQQNRPFVKFTG